MTGQEAGKGLARFAVRVVYLVLLGLTGGIIAGMLGFNEGISPFILIGIMVLYWTTVGKIFEKFGIAKPAPAEPTK